MLSRRTFIRGVAAAMVTANVMFIPKSRKLWVPAMDPTPRHGGVLVTTEFERFLIHEISIVSTIRR